MNQEDKAFKKEHEDLAGTILRPLAKPLVKILLKTSITPNQISMLSIVPVIISLFFLIKGGYKGTIIGSILALIYLLLDAIDGQLAREKNLKSKLGQWLDGIIGYVSIPFMILAASIGLKENSLLIVGSIAALCFPIQFTIIYFFNSEIKNSNQRVELPLPTKWNNIRYIYGQALFIPILLVSAIINKTNWTIWFYATFGHLFWMMILFIQYKDLKKKSQNSSSQI